MIIYDLEKQLIRYKNMAVMDKGSSEYELKVLDAHK